MSCIRINNIPPSSSNITQTIAGGTKWSTIWGVVVERQKGKAKVEIIVAIFHFLQRKCIYDNIVFKVKVEQTLNLVLDSILMWLLFHLLLNKRFLSGEYPRSSFNWYLLGLVYLFSSRIAVSCITVSASLNLFITLV